MGYDSQFNLERKKKSFFFLILPSAGIATLITTALLVAEPEAEDVPRDVSSVVLNYFRQCVPLGHWV